VPLRVDHVILGVVELDAGIRDPEELAGVTLVRGGVHPDGTANALLSLGPTTSPPCASARSRSR